MGGGHHQNARPDSAIVSSQTPCFGNAMTLRPYPRQHVIQGSGRLSCSLLTFLKWSTKPNMENTEASSTRTFTFPNTWIIQGPNALKTKRIIKWRRLKISHLHQAHPWLPNIKLFHVLWSLFKAMDRGIQWAHNCSIHSRVLLLGQCWSAPRCNQAIQGRGFLREGHAGFTILVENCDDTCAPPDHSNYKYCGIQCFSFMGAMVLGL